LWTKPDYQPNWHHQVLAERLEAVGRGQLRRLIVSMPPQHGKSELVCRRWPAWLLGRRPETKIILCTHTATLAEAHSRDIQRIMESEAYRRLFPEVLLPRAERWNQPGRWKRTNEYWELPQGGYLRAAGVGGAITGLRFDVGVIDDPIKSRQEADSPVERDRLWEWFVSDFFTRRSRDATIVVVMTRWHRDDLVGRLLRAAESGRGEPWEVVELPALARPDQRHPADPRRPGQALWPAFLDEAALQQIERQDPRAFAGLYQQDPQEAEAVEWPPEYFGSWLWMERWPPPQVDMWTMAIDPSRGRQDMPGDYAAIVAAGVDRKRQLVYVDARLDRWTPEETIRQALQLWDQYRPHYVAIESNQYHGLMERLFERASAERFGLRAPVWPIQNTEPKLMRIRRIGPYLAHRELRFRDCPDTRLLVDQLQDFPLGRYDDGPDALEMALRLLQISLPAMPEATRMRWIAPEAVPLQRRK